MPFIILSLPFWVYGSAGYFVSFIGEAMTLLVQWASCFSGSFIAVPSAPAWAIVLCVMGGIGLIYTQHHRGGVLPLCLYILGCCGLFMGRSPDIFLSHNWPFVGLYAQKTLFIPYDVLWSRSSSTSQVCGGEGSTGSIVRNWQQRTGGAVCSRELPKGMTCSKNLRQCKIKKNLEEDEAVLYCNQDGSIFFSWREKHVIWSMQDLRRLGATEVHIQKDNFIIESSALCLGKRPWNPFYNVRDNR